MQLALLNPHAGGGRASAPQGSLAPWLAQHVGGGVNFV
jgi:hypothetical protein